MNALRSCVLALGCTALACGGAAEPPPPHGEALVVVDTDLPVPALVSRMRVDLYSEDGRWFESRDIGRPDARDWPTSFSVYSDDDTKEKRVLVRVRVYPDGLTRDYEGERFAARGEYVSPPHASTLDALCADPPELPLGGRVTLRSGPDRLIDVVAGGRCEPSASGSVAARINITTAGVYRFYVADVYPYTTFLSLVLRSRCDDTASQIACRMEQRGGSVFTPGHLPRFDRELAPGQYFLMTTGLVPHWPADVTLEALPVDAPLPVSAPIAQATSRRVEPTLRRLDDVDSDETPRSEPLPTAAVDRLLLLRLIPGRRGRVRVTMRGACTGTISRLGRDPQRPDPATAETCVDAEGKRSVVEETRLEDDMTRSFASERGSFGKSDACPQANADDPFVCVPGGAFVLGSRVVSVGTATRAASTPERTAVIRRFWMDRFEVSVARLRDGVARGFSLDPTRINVNDRTIPTDGNAFDAYCSWSSAPRDRETLAVTCVNWEMARAFCQYESGDLPTESQWEFAATAAGRDRKTVYPWGDEEPTCDRAIMSRGTTQFGDRSCLRDGVLAGPQPIDAKAASDVTALGIVGLGGGVQEWTLDSGQPYASDCWSAASVVDPACLEKAAPTRSVRGGNWANQIRGAAERVHLPPGMAANGIPDTASRFPSVGFRCVYPERPR